MATFLSIEAQPSQIRVAEIEEKGKSSRIKSCFRFVTPQGAVEDGTIRDTKSLGDMLKHQLEQHNIKTKKVCFVTDSSRIASREVQIPVVKKNQIQSIIEANATDYFPIDVTKYVLSYTILEEVEKGEDKQYHLMVYAAPKSISAAYRELASVAELVMIGLNDTGNSIYHAVKEKFKEKTHMIIKIEEKAAGITIIRDGKPALQRNVNYGIDNAAETVKVFPVFGRDLDTAQALEVLCTRSCIRSSFDLAPDISEPEDTDDFVREARREVTESLLYLAGNISRIMDYYMSRNADVVFESISCCGFGAEVIGLPRLLSHELGQNVSVLKTLPGFAFPKDEADKGAAVYAAVLASMDSGVNLMEKTTKQQKEENEDLKGAFLILGVGVLAAVILAGSALGLRLYRTVKQNQLNKQIEEIQSVEQVYETYQSLKLKYEQFLQMYEYTNTPNESLVEFIEEMETKMPSAIVVETFSSTGTEVSFSMKVAGKQEAAKTMMQLREFESLSEVTTTGIDEAEDGTVSMSVTCTYAEPALLDKEQTESGQ